MLGLFTDQKDLEEKIFQKALKAKKPTFMQGLMGSGDYNKYVKYVVNQQKKQFDIEKRDFKYNYDREEDKLKTRIANQRKDAERKYNIDALRQQERRAKETQEKIAARQQLKEAEKQVDYELKHIHDQLDQMKKNRKKEEHDMRFRHKQALEQAAKDARQRLDEARKR